MNILAIDPGPEESAWCELRDDGTAIRHGKEPNDSIRTGLRFASTNARWSVDCILAVEMIASYGMPVGKEVFETCLWIGRFIEAWAARGGLYQLVYRKDVKVFHCNSTRATDANIRAAIIDKYGPGKAKAIGVKSAKGPLYGLKGDEWSALAIALKAAA